MMSIVWWLLLEKGKKNIDPHMTYGVEIDTREENEVTDISGDSNNAIKKQA